MPCLSFCNKNFLTSAVRTACAAIRIRGSKPEVDEMEQNRILTYHYGHGAAARPAGVLFITTFWYTEAAWPEEIFVDFDSPGNS